MIHTKQVRQWYILWILIILCLLITACQGVFSSDDAYTMEITGSGVISPVQVSLKQMKEMEEGLVEATYFSLNSYGTREYTVFKGVWLWHLLQESAQLAGNAGTVTLTAEDGYQVTFTLEEVKREDYIDEQDPTAAYKMIIAWEQAGEAFDPEKGNPFQLVMGQREPGDVNKPYWVRNIKTIDVK